MIHLLLTGALLLCPTATAAAAPAGDGATVLVIDGQPHTRGEYKDFLISEFGAGYLDVFVANRVIAKAASAEGITPTAKDLDAWIDEKLAQIASMGEYKGSDPEEFRKQYRPQARTMYCVEALVRKKRMSEDGIRREYDLLYGEKRRGRHILIRVGVEGPLDHSPQAEGEAKKKCEDLRAALVKGADFAELAKKESADRGSAEEGGDLGEFDAASPLVPEFLDAAMKLKEGEISEPVKTQFGWHLIQVTKVVPPAQPLDDKLKAELREKAGKRPVEQQEAGRVVRSLVEAAKVEKKLE